MWAAVDENRKEHIYEFKPYRSSIEWMPNRGGYMEVEQGTIKRLIGRELTWNDEPVEITGYND